MTGAQVNAILIGTGTIDTGAGTDTLNITSTSADLNTWGATDALISNLENISASAAAAAVTINMSGQTESFSITGSANADTLTGGSGADTITGGAGADRISDLGAGAITIASGAGADVMEFVSSAHATISDFTIGTDRLVMKGMSLSDIHVSRSGGNTYVDLDGGGKITLTGISATTTQMQISAYS